MAAHFQQTQQDFVRHLKDPDNHPFDYGIEDRRMAIYRELFFNNVVGFLDSGFPVLKSLYPEQDWHQLARQFYAEHHCRSPYIVDISKEFVEYLAGEYTAQDRDPPFLQELAHYEWLELDVSVRKTTKPHQVWDQQSEVNGVWLSELASVVSYPFPVHQISQEFQPGQPTEPMYYVVYRDEEDEVQFLLINQVTAYMLTVLEQHGDMAVDELISQLQQALPQLPEEQVETSMRETLQQLLAATILLPVSQ